MQIKVSCNRLNERMEGDEKITSKSFTEEYFTLQLNLKLLKVANTNKSKAT